MTHFTISNSTGSGNSVITITPASANTSTTDITETITVRSGGGLTQSITLIHTGLLIQRKISFDTYNQLNVKCGITINTIYCGSLSFLIGKYAESTSGEDSWLFDVSNQSFKEYALTVKPYLCDWYYTELGSGGNRYIYYNNKLVGSFVTTTGSKHLFHTNDDTFIDFIYDSSINKIGYYLGAIDISTEYRDVYSLSFDDILNKTTNPNWNNNYWDNSYWNKLPVGGITDEYKLVARSDTSSLLYFYPLSYDINNDATEVIYTFTTNFRNCLFSSTSYTLCDQFFIGDGDLIIVLMILLNSNQFKIKVTALTISGDDWEEESTSFSLQYDTTFIYNYNSLTIEGDDGDSKYVFDLAGILDFGNTTFRFPNLTELLHASVGVIV